MNIIPLRINRIKLSVYICAKKTIDENFERMFQVYYLSKSVCCGRKKGLRDKVYYLSIEYLFICIEGVFRYLSSVIYPPALAFRPIFSSSTPHFFVRFCAIE